MLNHRTAVSALLIGALAGVATLRADNAPTTRPSVNYTYAKNGLVTGNAIVTGGGLLKIGPPDGQRPMRIWLRQDKPEMEKAAFLGVNVSRSTRILSEQLGLPNGVGLVVESVMDDAPAKAAGLQPRDVIHKLNDQVLINPEQFATLVRTFKPGEEVTLTVIRKSQPTTLKVKLIERELPVLTDNFVPMNNFNGFGGPNQPFTFQPGSVTIQGNNDGDPLLYRGLLDYANGAAAGPEPRVISIQGGKVNQISSWADSNGTINLVRTDDNTQLKVTDSSGKTVFDGSYNTDEEKAKLPEAFRARVNSMLEKQKKDSMPAIPLIPPPHLENPNSITPGTQPSAQAPLELDPIQL